ncbi:MAG: DegT/DnrJ/EryC1/StrS family aminotransferase [Bacteroidetes bacterium]|nr:DegT/DnrJ/EryC1/StrS family aminotransferase [Bacteroidota bacterium]
MEFKYPVYQPHLKGNEKKYVMDCLDRNWISSRGNYIGEFEKKFAEYVGIEYATTVCNGTAAILLALQTLGIGPGDEVILPTLVYVAVPNMVLMAGATPVFVDALPDTWQMDPDDINRKITAKTKCIIVVHNYGHPCSMEIISGICRKEGFYLIEDCAEALGAKFQNRHVGSWGDISTYSFFGNKTITTGEGGMLTSHSEELIRKAAHLKNQGVTSRVYWHDVLANNYRMTNLTAAIGLAQLEQIDEILRMKRMVADHYRNAFENSSFEFHKEVEGTRHSYWMCSILTAYATDREPLREYLALQGIETRPFFYPSHIMPVYESMKQKGFPVSENLSARGLNLPSYPSLTGSDVDYIASKVFEYERAS